MKKLIRFALPLIIGSTVMINPFSTFAQMEKMNKSTKGEELRLGMHKLWTDHVVWTRNVILNIMDGLPGTDQAVNRLLQNQEDIGNAIKPVYGDAAGTELPSPHPASARETETGY